MKSYSLKMMTSTSYSSPSSHISVVFLSPNYKKVFTYSDILILGFNHKCLVKKMKQMTETYSYLNGECKYWISGGGVLVV